MNCSDDNSSHSLRAWNQDRRLKIAQEMSWSVLVHISTNVGASIGAASIVAVSIVAVYIAVVCIVAASIVVVNIVAASIAAAMSINATASIYAARSIGASIGTLEVLGSNKNSSSQSRFQ